MDAKDRIIVALDVSSLDEARALVEALKDDVGMFKIGFELIHAVGTPQAVNAVHDLGGKVFLDAKLHDIPNTVGAAAKGISSQGVAMFNVHASAGIPAMKAAVANKKESLALAVTVLTSLGEDMAAHIYGIPASRKVVYFATDALVSRMDGVICSPKELLLLAEREEFGRGFLKVTPGVRPAWASLDDQSRVSTPEGAILAGADMLVVGRPITNPPKEIGAPRDAARRIAEEIAQALDGR